MDRISIINASKEYDEFNYPEEFYKYHLEILKITRIINNELLNAIKYLFFWKLGKITLKKTSKSIFTGYQDSKNQKYFFTNTTSNNNKAIEKAINKNNIEAAFKFRDNNLDYGKFKLISYKITVTSIVLPIFYIHIWKPEKYPILDKKVWRVYCKEIGKPISKNTKPENLSDYEKYLKFFNDIISTSKLDWRTIDKGLWVLGDNLPK